MQMHSIEKYARKANCVSAVTIQINMTYKRTHLQSVVGVHCCNRCKKKKNKLDNNIDNGTDNEIIGPLFIFMFFFSDFYPLIHLGRQYSNSV